MIVTPLRVVGDTPLALLREGASMHHTDRRNVADFLAWGVQGRRWRPETVDGYRHRINAWLIHLRHHGIKPRHATAAQVRAWLDENFRNPNTRETTRATLIAFYDWTQATGQRRDNPARAVESARRPKGDPRSLPPWLVARIITASDERGPEWGLMVRLFAYTGLRRGEVRKVAWSDLEDYASWLRIIGKGGQVRTLPLVTDVRRAAMVWSASCPSPVWVFPSPLQPGQPISRATVTNRITALGEDVDYHFTSHQLRHSYATRLVEMGVPLPTIMDAMRHDSLSSTTVYTRSRPEQVRAALEGLDYREEA